MPYDPGNPDAFRRILKRLSKELFLSSEKAINLVHADRKSSSQTGQFDLTRSALDRFKSNHPIRDVAGLRELWRVLESHEEYGHFFPREPDAQEMVPPEVALSSALKRFFTPPDGAPVRYKVDEIASIISGRFVMYRPNWRQGAGAGSMRASIVEIWTSNGILKISETQNFMDGTRWFEQKDTGLFFAFGEYLDFLMKETDKGTTIRLGVVDGMLPENGPQEVEWFHGVLYTASNLAIYPSAKFFCDRITEGSPVRVGIMKLGEIPSEEAKQYLSTPIKPYV